MNPLTPLARENSRLLRRITRLFSLLLLGFYLSLILFNDDVRSDPTLPFVLYSLVILTLLVDWRWEKSGGLLTMTSALVLGLFLVVNSVLNYDFGLVPVVFGAFLLTFPFFMVGWLFHTLGQHARMSNTPAGD